MKKYATISTLVMTYALGSFLSAASSISDINSDKFLNTIVEGVLVKGHCATLKNEGVKDALRKVKIIAIGHFAKKSQSEDEKHVKIIYELLAESTGADAFLFSRALFEKGPSLKEIAQSKNFTTVTSFIESYEQSIKLKANHSKRQIKTGRSQSLPADFSYTPPQVKDRESEKELSHDGNNKQRGTKEGTIEDGKPKVVSEKTKNNDGTSVGSLQSQNTDGDAKDYKSIMGVLSLVGITSVTALALWKLYRKHHAAKNIEYEHLLFT